MTTTTIPKFPDSTFTPELWSTAVIDAYKKSLTHGTSITGLWRDEMTTAAVQIGDMVGLMNTPSVKKLRGLDWYYIGVTYSGDAIVSTKQEDIILEELSKLYIRQIECYGDAAYCRMRYNKRKNLGGNKLKPLQKVQLFDDEMGRVVTTTYYGTKMIAPDFTCKPGAMIPIKSKSDVLLHTAFEHTGCTNTEGS